MLWRAFFNVVQLHIFLFFSAGWRLMFVSGKIWGCFPVRKRRRIFLLLHDQFPIRSLTHWLAWFRKISQPENSNELNVSPLITIAMLFFSAKNATAIKFSRTLIAPCNLNHFTVVSDFMIAFLSHWTRATQFFVYHMNFWRDLINSPLKISWKFINFEVFLGHKKEIRSRNKKTIKFYFWPLNFFMCMIEVERVK